MALLTACTALVPPPPPPQALSTIPLGHGYRFSNLKTGPGNSDATFVMLAFSGGGTRSAALAYGVLETLRDTPIAAASNARRLLDEVDVISSVSGGSYAAVYYGLHRERFFEQFPQRFLRADFQSEIWDRYVSVTGLSQMLGWTENDRIDHLTALLDQRLFDGQTYADLLKRPERPLIVVHATDLALGADFQFTQDQFDGLCIDLGTVPLARAVAASSAVPVLFGPVTLKNHAGNCGYVQPRWVDQAAQAPADQSWGLRARRHAANVASYLDSSVASGRPWLHLIDGGVSDNLGLRGPLESSLARGGLAPLLQRMGLRGVRKVVFVVVSAEVLPNHDIDHSGKPPSAPQMASAVIDSLMNANSFETLTWLRTSFRYWREEARELEATSSSPYAPHPDFYLVEANLRDLPDPAERARMMATPTTLKLEPQQIESLIRAGHTLLEASPEFRRLRQDLNPGLH